MTTPLQSPPTASPLVWTADGQPRSGLFGDVYFSAQDGLAESRAVFLEGCGLPDAWAGRRRFTVAELGFGTGLNIVALLDLWRRTRPADGQLHIFSVEAFPVTAQEAARALGHWQELAPIVGLLTARWPGRARGRHRVDLPEFNAVLDLAVLDVGKALEGWGGAADAWFLDGFSPALNPQMWSDEVLALVAARSGAGARAATFTVAGQVRRGLAAAGFQVEKRPGFGRKRERLEARLSGVSVDTAAPVRVAIVGAGIAGACAARAVRALGGEAVVLEAAHAGAGGSGNPAALVTPRLDAGLGEAARLFAQAFARATGLYAGIEGAVLAHGVVQLATTDRDVERFGRIAASDVFEPGTMEVMVADTVTARLGEPAPGGLDQRTALVVDPARILEAWLGPVRTAHAARLRRDDGGWRVLDEEGVEILRADAVILAAALGSRELAADLPLSPVRGQVSWSQGGSSTPAAAWGGYVAPTATALLFGATHDREDDTSEVREGDHRRNLDLVAAVLPRLGDRLGAGALGGRASVRAVTPDRLPLAGACSEPGLFALTGFGSRGFSFAPLLAEHVAALVLGGPSPISRAAADLLDPARFARRAARRLRS